MRELKTIFLIDKTQNSHFDLEAVYEALIDHNDSDVHPHLLRLLKEELSQITNENVPKSLLRFCSISNEKSFSEIKKDIQLGRLTFSNPFNFNDPMDPILKVWLKMNKRLDENPLNKKFFKSVVNALKNLRICCMADPTNLSDNLPLMWSHYANNHKGIAIKYKITKDALNRYNDNTHLLRLCPVAYHKHKPLNYSITIDNALFAKGHCWNYEAEHRLIYFSEITSEFKENDNTTGKLKRKDYLPLSGFDIEKVYLGAEIEENKRIEILKITKSKNIPTFKMRYDSYDITRLQSELIS